MTKFEAQVVAEIREKSLDIAEALFYEDYENAEFWHEQVQQLHNDLDNYRAQVAEDEEAMKLENKLCGYIR